MLKAKNIIKKYGELVVLDDVSLEIKEGELVCLLGYSGAGKSTLLHILGTLDEANSGSIFFNEQAVHEWNENQKSQFRNESIGFVFQFHHLLEEFKAIENVAIPRMIKGVPQKQALEEAENMLIRVGLKERLHHLPSQLSGGEQQRVAVARALINKPQLILADEPTGNLDAYHTDELFQLFLELNQEYHIAFLIATHNLKLPELAHRTLKIQKGKIIE
ncbi:MAG: lipoprotein-releasing system ATP-binding protein LolD [Bacteroidia bacterium]|nr:MAG: lipoprotein-releasing system ATP-binding protein LolD [Bacteroidia bacterium]